MNTEKFINLVFDHKCLWDQGDSTYHLRDHQRKAWKEISEELEICVDELKKKWRGLRDTFGKELKKMNCKTSGQAADAPNPSWPYFRLLLFLRNTMSQRNLKGSIPKTSQNSWGSTSLDGDETNISILPSLNQSSENDYDNAETEITPKRTFKSPLKKRSKIHSPDEIDRKLLKIEEKRLKCLQQNSNDSDVQFLSSLLPFLKDVPKHRKLIVRTKLMQVFINEQNAASPVVELCYSSDSTQCSDNFSMTQNNPGKT